MKQMALRIGVIVITVLWIVGMGWYQYIREAPYDFNQGDAKAAYQTAWRKCKSNDRTKQYDCREALLRNQKTAIFNEGTGKFVPTFGPPLGFVLLYFGWLNLLHRRELTKVKERSLSRRAEIRAEAEEEAEKERAKRQTRLLEKKVAEDRKSSITKAVSKARVNEWPEPIIVMLVDEDTDLTSDIQQSLDREQYHTIISRDLTDSVIGLDTIQYNLFVIDIFTKGGNGIEIISKIAKENPNIKLIATASDQEGMPASITLEAAKKLGAHAILAKPYQMLDLVDMIDDIAS
jgi:ActR/RegA family two-component response regulator